MTKFYSVALLAGALVAGSLAADAKTASASKPRFKHGRQIEAPVHPAYRTLVAAKKAAGKKKAVRKPVSSLAENQTWLPVTQVVSVWDGEWIEIEKYSTTWNANGKPVINIIQPMEDEVTDFTKEEYTYDDYGYQTGLLTSIGESLDDLTATTRTTREYDPVVHHLVTYQVEETFDGSEWVKSGNEFRRIVTRDNAGNITKVEVQTPYEDRWDPMEKYEIEYGADGKASKISFSEMEYDWNTFEPTDWSLRYVYDHIEWYCTDGQIYDMDCIYESTNKVKTFSQMVGDEVACVSTVTYVGDTDDFVLVGDMGWAVFTQTWTNHENGGYTNHTVQVDEPEEEGMEPMTETMVECVKYDALGNGLLEVGYYIYDGELMLETYSKGEDLVDASTGFITEYTLTEFWPAEEEPVEGEEEWYALSRAEVDDILAPLEGIEGEWVAYLNVKFSDYQPAGSAALDKIDAEIADGKAEYFTIDGRRVNGTPAAGLYIRRTASGATKVLVK